MCPGRKDICKSPFIAVLFATAKDGKQPRSPSRGHWVSPYTHLID